MFGTVAETATKRIVDSGDPFISGNRANIFSLLTTASRAAPRVSERRWTSSIKIRAMSPKKLIPPRSRCLRVMTSNFCIVTEQDLLEKEVFYLMIREGEQVLQWFKKITTNANFYISMLDPKISLSYPSSEKNTIRRETQSATAPTKTALKKKIKRYLRSGQYDICIYHFSNICWSWVTG